MIQGELWLNLYDQSWPFARRNLRIVKLCLNSINLVWLSLEQTLHHPRPKRLQQDRRESNVSKKNNYIKPATFSNYWQHKSMLTCFKEWDLQAICSYSARYYYDKQLQLQLASLWGFQSQPTHTSLGESHRTSCLCYVFFHFISILAIQHIQ